MSTVLFANSVKKKINIKDFDLASMSKSPLKNGMTIHSGSSYSVNQFKRNRYESILYIYIYILPSTSFMIKVNITKCYNKYNVSRKTPYTF